MYHDVIFKFWWIYGIIYDIKNVLCEHRRDLGIRGGLGEGGWELVAGGDWLFDYPKEHNIIAPYFIKTNYSKINSMWTMFIYGLDIMCFVVLASRSI